MNGSLRLTFDILSYWRCGTGSSSGSEIDATCARDTAELPYIPGRQVRGLLRDAVRRLDELDPDGPQMESDLFDGPADQAIGKSGGLLEVESAHMADPDRSLFAGDAAARAELFTALSSTRIDERGVAAERTLRREEVAIPMRLEASVTALPGASLNWRETLIEAAALIEGVGAKRTRGLGRVIVDCKEEATNART